MSQLRTIPDDPDHGERTTTAADLMTPHVHTCRTTDTLNRAAQLMWEHDCGAIPVLDDGGYVVSVVTDRDICMAAYTRGKPLNQIPVTVAASHTVRAVRPDASIWEAQHLMRMHRIRRLPVIDRGGHLVGILSLADIVRHAHAMAERRGNGLHVDELATTLGEVSRHSDGVARG